LSGKSVAYCIIYLAAMLVATLLLDGLVRPRRRGLRRLGGVLLHGLAVAATFGFWLLVSGSPLVAAVLGLGLMALLGTVSNAKHAMLGEPLLFSDLALLAAIVRHPRFYFTAISMRERAALAAGGPIMLAALVWLSATDIGPHLAGAGLLLLGGPWLAGLGREPAIERDLAGYGLVPTLLVYWWRWRATPDPEPCSAPLAAAGPEGSPPDIIVVVQCESFADPVDLTGDERHALPGLDGARARAWQWGDLGVSGFGAYTMRTEYGVLFGRSEAELGFRRYDPFLTAHGEVSYALAARLGTRGYRALFVHPHDMRFYGRDRLMPAIGFDRLVGEESFAPPPPDGGRYVDDRTLGASIGDLIDAATEPTLIYAVTMENHGPWDKDRLTGSLGGLDAYLRHLRNSDAMLVALTERLSRAGRPGLLVFFGDHRPSIPGVTEPGGARHTPYVMLRFGADGRIEAGDNRRVDLLPDGLHHAILRCVQDQGAVPGGMAVSPPVARG
jgi:hypothetical protein